MMDFQLTEDQEALVAALQSILQDHQELPQSERFSFSYFNAALQDILGQSGFLDAARDIGPLEGALVVAETARLPILVEASATGLVAPMVVPGERLDGPIALIDARNLAKAHRNLPIARTALIDMGDDVAIVPVSADAVEAVESIYGFPYGRFVEPPVLADTRILRGAGPRLRLWWRIALAVEIAGAAMAAIDFTIDYVKQRMVFGRAIGSFQTVQHRLVQCRAFALATHYLAMRAAWSGEAVHADLAATHAQHGIGKLMFDLHQFHGGMGVTTEHLLHFWTYRVRALQAEAGGVHGAALDAIDRLWGDDAVEPAATVRVA
jgi:hypothetical protein